MGAGVLPYPENRTSSSIQLSGEIIFFANTSSIYFIMSQKSQEGDIEASAPITCMVKENMLTVCA